MSDRPSPPPPGSDEAFLEQAVFSMKGDLPDEARMNRLRDRLAPVLEPETQPAPGWGRRSWVIVVGAATVLVGTAVGSRYASHPSTAAELTVPSTPEPTETKPVPIAPASPVPTMSVEALPSSVEAVPSAPLNAHAATPRAPNLAEEAKPGDELALLESARNALATEPSRALELTSEHMKRFSKPSFAQERERLAIDALVRLGRRPDAQARARSFEATYPNSPHLARVRALVAPRSTEETEQ